MFLGTHSPRLDDKGRMFLPAKYREDLADGVVITKGQERCLYVFHAEEFARITEALRSAPVTAKQGRVTIPQGLRDYAGLQRECVVIGANTRLEIWDNAAWTAYLADQEDAFSAASEEVLPGVL